VPEIVRAYEQGGAAALSVLTDEAHFGGSYDDLREAREACDLPILQKDFIVDRYQLYEAAVNGADAVLLIVAALSAEDLAALHDAARGLDLDCLVEIHNEEELERALAVEAEVLGINNRNLADFSLDLDTTFELMPDVPAGKTVVSESGIAEESTREHLLP
jgi:indole-3-glycerol phosphate synthase